MMFKILATIFLVGFVAAQNSSNDTTTIPVTNETTTTVITTTVINTTVTTTKLTPSTTTAPPTLANITLPKNSPNYTCLKLQFNLAMSIKYSAQINTTTVQNVSTNIKFPSDYDYDGTCGETLESVTIKFFDDWSLMFEYSLDGDKYELSSAILTYVITDEHFPNATADLLNKTIVANASDLHLFSGNKNNAYKCNAKTSLDLGSEVTIDLSNYLGQPFYGKKDSGFSTAVDCPADTTGTSKLVPIIVGAALAFLVVLVLIAYLIGRKRHRSGYQSV